MKTCKNGSALVTLMVTLLLATSVSTAVVWATQQSAYQAVRIFEYLKAQAYAEAGANMAYSILKEDFSASTDPSKFPAGHLGDGSFSLTVTPIGTSTVSIASRGVCRRASYTVLADVKDFGGSSGGGPQGDPSNPFGYAVLSGSSQSWSGSGTLNLGGGSIHGNGQFKMVGSGKVKGSVTSTTEIKLTGSSQIDGDAAAPSISASGGAITGSRSVNPVPPVNMPDIDLAPYYNEALKNGQVKGSSFTWTGSGDLVIPGGILWVNGDFKYSGSGKVIGCIIATGKIDWSGSGDQVKVGNLPALVSRDGNIGISGSSRFHGLICAKTGNFSKTGSGEVTGSIMAAGTFTKGGSWSLMNYEDSTPVAPGTAPKSGHDVRITAWQK